MAIGILMYIVVWLIVFGIIMFALLGLTYLNNITESNCIGTLTILVIIAILATFATNLIL